MNWKEEFPDFDHMPDIPENWTDVSRHGDSCPSFQCGELLIFTDYASPARRELAPPFRFVVVNDKAAETLLETDDWSAVLAIVAAGRMTANDNGRIIPGKMPEVQANIDRAGQHVFGILGGSGNSWFYTIGNASLGLPELLLIGNFPPDLGKRILNDLGAKMREDRKPLPEGLLDIGWSFPFKIRAAGGDVRDRLTIQAGQYLGHENYAVLQVMICDKHGLYPGDAGCTPVFDVERP